jgi:predicted transposase YdaD
MEANSKHKNSVFSLLFSDPVVLRELYCALTGVELSPDVTVTVSTLSNALFMGRVNDVSFEIGGRLVVLIEHQSSINPNMALRLLMYIARVYESIVKTSRIYSKKKITVPRPEFFVLYNGKETYPDEGVMRLSDLYESTDGLGLPEKEAPALELAVRVININEGKNLAIAERCTALAGYSVFVAKVREYVEDGEDLTEALKKAVRYCRKHDILGEFLRRNSAEVMGMLFGEWDLDEAKEVWYEDGLEDGLERGIEKGLERGRAEGQLEIARKMKAVGIPVETIHAVTGLPSGAIDSM